VSRSCLQRKTTAIRVTGGYRTSGVEGKRTIERTADIRPSAGQPGTKGLPENWDRSPVARPADWIEDARIHVRFEDGKLAEHWDVLQDDATEAGSDCPTSPRSPWQNALADRLIRSIRRVPARRSKSRRPQTPLRLCLSELRASDSDAAPCAALELAIFRVAEESTARGANLADCEPGDSPYSSLKRKLRPEQACTASRSRRWRAR
jgi:hypothetical protein